MTRRWPLLVSLLPLALGLATYGMFWRGWAADFETTLARWFPGERPVATGFPYRLESELAGVTTGWGSVSATIDRLRLNRGPWRPELTVMQGQGVAVSARLAGLSARVAATVATASLKLDGGRVARFSLVLPAARGNVGLGPDFAADTLELHAREMNVREITAKAGAGPSLPVQGQLVIGATGFRLGQGAPIGLAGDIAARGGARLADARAWADQGGSLDAVLTGTDATGEVFKLEATLVPLQGGLRLAGTITTVCPLSVQAALNGTAAPAEQRLRAPVRLALESALPAGGPVALSGIPADLATRSRRGQLPACPALR
ncbi:MAG: hypothetical protein RIS17_1349 [Pseudomonadota bacterium]|jgi:hypothetical protein